MADGSVTASLAPPLCAPPFTRVLFLSAIAAGLLEAARRVGAKRPAPEGCPCVTNGINCSRGRGGG